MTWNAVGIIVYNILVLRAFAMDCNVKDRAVIPMAGYARVSKMNAANAVIYGQS